MRAEEDGDDGMRGDVQLHIRVVSCRELWIWKCSCSVDDEDFNFGEFLGEEVSKDSYFHGCCWVLFLAGGTAFE